MTETRTTQGTELVPCRNAYAVPAVNIRETKESYVLEADLPGVTKESIEITLEGSELTLIGRRSIAEQPGEVLLRESRPMDYRRVFEIAPTIDTAGITASMKQGTLTLTLPKSEAIKPRRIAVAA